MTSDILDRLAAYAPSPRSFDGEWGPAERDACLGATLDEEPAHHRRLHFVPRLGALQLRTVAPIAASVVVLALAGTLAVVAGPGSDGHPGLGPGAANASTKSRTAPVFRATVATPRLRAHQWAYRALSSYDISPNADAAAQDSAVWVARDGSGRSLTKGAAGLGCRRLDGEGESSFAALTQSAFDKFPDDADALRTYLTKRVEGGSTSREEAIFTGVGDLLRDGDLLASSAQRAAMVTVVAGLRRTSVHSDLDERGRTAVRVDFVDPNQRGSEVQSLYFDPRTFQLLEERTSEGAFTPNAGPSAPYTSTPSEQASSDQQLPVKGSVTVMTTEKIVSAFPANCGLK